MLNGIDVSNYQAGLSQDVMAKADVIICKATEGTGYQDPHLPDLFTKAVSAGKKVGAYHFWRPGASGTVQADYFVDYLQATQMSPDFAVLDFEDESDLANEAGAVEFMRRVQERLGIPVWFYVYVAPLKQYGYWKIRKNFKIWLAGYYLGYNQINGFVPPMSLDEYILFNQIDSTGIDFAGWQFTPVGRLPGYAGDLDLNVFFEDAFTGSTAPAVGTAQTVTLEPVTGYPVTQNFGDGAGLTVNGVKTNVGGAHTGIDFATPVGTSAVALESGTVLWADWGANLPQTNWADRWYLGGGGFGGLAIDPGIVVVIQHPGYISTYSHLSATSLNVGDSVIQGQEVGKTGATGFVSGAHLHFEVLPTPTNYQTDHTNLNIIYGRVDPRPYFVQTVENQRVVDGAATLRVALEKEKKELSILTEKFKNFKTGGETDAATELGWLPQNFQTVFESISNIRKEVLNQKILKQGGTQKKGETTSLALEVSYMADNFARTHQALDRIEKRIAQIDARLNEIEGK
ncbi:peptidoglycan DD-metalloendopeptidase family protein [Rothia amarae]|uniref:Peptidoglycan DD-metalloendopeptidase family protein n=1 Tax=Rothia amarae TaxID=169480 RepID=A0A7H2BLY5_9MICC|nr:GH25 family lysozyme [Rothia amarae]QNV40681.1 peptidoglycan DD-metalloendopeptidase family protein [Rothia amarae]